MNSEKQQENEERPLEVEVLDGRIVISIGIETLKYCHNQLEELQVKEGCDCKGFLIEDAEGFARDFVNQLHKDREDGSTKLTDLFDEIMLDTANNGSIHTRNSK